MGSKSMTAGHRTPPLAYILVGLGAFFLTVSVALVFFVVPDQKKTPLDTHSTTVTETVPGTVLVGKALATNTPIESAQDRPECQPTPQSADDAADNDPADSGDPDSSDDTEAQDAPPGEADDADNADDPGEPLPVSCFIEVGTPMYSQRHVSVVEPSDAEMLTFQAAQSVVRADKQSGVDEDHLVSATLDRVTLDRRSADPVVEEMSSLALIPDYGVAPPGFVRNGFQYKFPLDAQRQSYDYFDANTFTTNPIEYVGESTIAGIETYEYEQELGPIDMYQSLRDHFASVIQGYDQSVESILASYQRKDTTAGVWGLPGDPERSVDMRRFYTNTRTLYVEPVTGRIVLGKEDIFQFFAEDQEEADAFWSDKAAVDAERQNPTRTAFAFTAGWDTPTIEDTASDIQESLSLITTFGRVLPAVLALLGVLAVAAGMFLGMRTPATERRRRKR